MDHFSHRILQQWTTSTIKFLTKGVDPSTGLQTAHPLIKVSLPASVSSMDAQQLLSFHHHCHLNHLKFPPSIPIWRWTLPSGPNPRSTRTSTASHFPLSLFQRPWNCLFRHRLNHHPFTQLLPWGQQSQHASSLRAQAMTGRLWDIHKPHGLNLRGEEVFPPPVTVKRLKPPRRRCVVNRGHRATLNAAPR